MRQVLQLPDFLCDIPGWVSSINIPNFGGTLVGVALQGRKAADIERIRLRANGLILAEFGPVTDDDGQMVSGGENAARLASLLGPFNHGVIPVMLCEGGGLEMSGGGGQVPWVALDVWIASEASRVSLLRAIAIVEMRGLA